MNSEQREQRNRLIVQRYVDGVNFQEIGDLFNLSGAAVATIVRQYGICTRRYTHHSKRVSKFEQQVELSSKLWNEGVAVRQIGEQLGWNPTGVGVRISLLRKKYPDKFPYRPRGRQSKHDTAARIACISELWIGGATREQIADRFGWKLSTVGVRISELRSTYPQMFPCRPRGPAKVHHEQ